MMSSSVELSLFPSCFGALDWSPEGELAVAAGDQVQIWTWRPPKHNSEQGDHNGWQLTRIPKVNVFTVAEWGMIYPQSRDNFSIAVEQSASSVVGLSWSPPGLARYRRSVLAIWTSNLLLSLWEPVGINGQWARVCIVNHALYPNLGNFQDIGGIVLRRASIRSFNWCSPLQVPADGPESATAPESRWGVQMLAITNDANEVVLLRVFRPSGLQASSDAYIITKLTAYPLDGAERQFPMVGSGSLLQNALQAKARITSVMCSPWLNLPTSENGPVHSAGTMVAVVYGTELRILQATVALGESDHEVEVTPRYDVMMDIKPHPFIISDSWAHRMSGPLGWLHTGQSDWVVLAVGIIDGVVTISLPRSVCDGSEKNLAGIKTQEWPRSSWPTPDGESFSRTLERISSFLTTTAEQHKTCTLQIGTLGGLGTSITLDQSGALGPWKVPLWMKAVEDFREDYDLDRDLGGYTAARIWGLSMYRGLTAALFTMHPTDMVEYRVSSNEKAIIVFTNENTLEAPDFHTLFTPHSVDSEPQFARDQREKAISSVLASGEQEKGENKEDDKLVYAAACCALVDGHSNSIRAQARECLERLANKTGADLSDEISKCDLESSTISAKSTDQQTMPGGHLFEYCEICGTGLTWDSANEAQCANGHLLVRCGLSFLAIQEPGISKYCPICRTEYFDEDLLARVRKGHIGPKFMQLFEAFDTCIYCDMKFQASV
ncbi:uncharacterized protein N7484_006825 [Penicillium longicatenatum]|uniref:uncharacterized protein n=1 Tax=Penicillium longicatenatum TaxID=1561947 RepID=UPI002548BAD0|nr:uncharacterized protein N7484_006825 [Penicillium longicatenatum]KAJ5638963.1 hypothetical protein N7484_006825 [Penicillium longicatenatum]